MCPRKVDNMKNQTSFRTKRKKKQYQSIFGNFKHAEKTANVQFEHNYSIKTARSATRTKTRTAKEDWKAGRRIVELKVIVDGLKECRYCKKSLKLRDIVGESKHGLGGNLKILCKICRKVNLVAMGKKHKSNKIWDVNSKAALGRYIESINTNNKIELTCQILTNLGQKYISYY